MTISIEQAQVILMPFLERIEISIANAIEEYNKIDIQTRSKFKKRTKASIINDFMAFNAAKELEGLPGVLFSHNRQRFSVFLDNEFQLMFKKLDCRLRPSNIQTLQVFQIENQIQTPLPDMPSPVTHIYAGYVWNDLQTAIKDIYLTCPNGKYNEWELKISAVKSPQVSPAEALTSSASDSQTRRVFPKETDNSDE